MNVCDIVIIILLGFGAVLGFKSGVIKKLADFVGLFAIVIIAFSLKNNLSVLLYENLPFFDFGNFINGFDAINILFYEVIAFLIVFIILLFFYKTLLVITGLVEKILKTTVILSIPSKILGIFVGMLEYYVYIFIILVIATLPIFEVPFVKESKIANYMLHNTPILTPISTEIVDVYDGVYQILEDRNKRNNEELNGEIVKFLIDKKVLTKDSAKKLVDRNKLHINDMSIVE